MDTLTSLVRAARPLWHRATLVPLLAFAGAGCDSVTSPQPPSLSISLDGAEVTRTSIDDGLIQAGERVFVDLFVSNTGPTAYEDLHLTAASTRVPYFSPPAVNPGLNGAGPSSITRIEPGQTVRVVVEFNLVPNVPVGTSIPINLTLTARDRTSATVSTALTTAELPYRPSAEGIVVTRDTDGDGRVEPGEEATVGLLIRSGTESSTQLCFTGRVSTTLAQVTLLGGVEGTCNVEARTFRFRASSTLVSGTALPFVITVSDGLSNTWDFPFSLPLG